jgi:hypothetical protein
MDTGKVLLLGGVAVGGYFAYQWYAGPGGYSDQQLCGTQTGAQLQALAGQIIAAAAAANMTPALYIAAQTGATPQALACARVAIAQYPTAKVAAAVTSPATSTAAPSTATSATTTAPVVSATPAAPAANSLDAIYANLSNVAQAAGINVTTGIGPTAQGPNNPIDYNGWNYYLGQVYGGTIPNAGFPASAQSQPMTLAAYWSVMSPALASANGLSGLGIFGGLGQIARAQRGW